MLPVLTSSLFRSPALCVDPRQLEAALIQLRIILSRFQPLLPLLVLIALRVPVEATEQVACSTHIPPPTA